MKAQLVEKFRAAYGRSPEICAYAPGRIEFIGNHTDYNAGTVLGAALDRGVWVALAGRADARRQWASDQRPGRVISNPVDSSKRSGPESWVNYPLGVLAALPEFGVAAPAGFDFLAMSNLPSGAGLSSSAAIELSSALAFLEMAGARLPRETVVKIARHAENYFVGVPCGILDQGVSGFGQKNKLVWIDCRGPVFATVPLPSAAHFWIFNTHTKHALVDGLYAARHRECMTAARVLGVGSLVETNGAALASAEVNLLPVVARRARHVVDEIARVALARTTLEAGDLVAVGQLLTASHRSSQSLFENSTEELDFLVDTLVASQEVFGARLTGGGFGGAVMALTNATFGESEARVVAAAYQKKFGATPEILHAQTGDGAALI
ncbi:MAG: galactokinase [Opitutaceae bacterium]|jgi:galactokinase